jgi:hypothetical protein
LKTQEDLWIRCPRLGGETPFTYCLKEGGDMPCARIVVCWQAFFPVETHLRKMLSSRRWEAFTQRKPQEKIASLLELVEEAKKNDNQ